MVEQGRPLRVFPRVLALRLMRDDVVSIIVNGHKLTLVSEWPFAVDIIIAPEMAVVLAISHKTGIILTARAIKEDSRVSTLNNNILKQLDGGRPFRRNRLEHTGRPFQRDIITPWWRTLKPASPLSDAIAISMEAVAITAFMKVSEVLPAVGDFEIGEEDAFPFGDYVLGLDVLMPDAFVMEVLQGIGETAEETPH